MAAAARVTAALAALTCLAGAVVVAAGAAPAGPAPPIITLFAPFRLDGGPGDDLLLSALGTWLRLGVDGVEGVGDAAPLAGGGGEGDAAPLAGSGCEGDAAPLARGEAPGDADPLATARGEPSWVTGRRTAPAPASPTTPCWPFPAAGPAVAAAAAPLADIILFADDGGARTCRAVRALARCAVGGGADADAAAIAANPVRCVDACVHACHARPNMTCLVDRALRLARTPLVALVNSDIALGPDFGRAIRAALDGWPATGRARPDVVLVGRRIDVQVDVRLDFGDPAWLGRLAARAATHGRLHGEYGVDYLAAPASLWARPGGPLAMPPFVAGAFRWDSYVLAQAIVHPGTAVVDATAAVSAFHLQATIADAEADADAADPHHHARRAGAAHNDRLARALTGDRYLMGRTSLAGYELAPGGDVVVARV